MPRWFRSSPLAPPSSKSAEVFLKRGSTAKSKSNFFSEMVEKSLTRLASALCVYGFSLVSIMLSRCLPFVALFFPFVSLHPRFRLSWDQSLCSLFLPVTYVHCPQDHSRVCRSLWLRNPHEKCRSLHNRPRYTKPFEN